MALAEEEGQVLGKEHLTPDNSRRGKHLQEGPAPPPGDVPGLKEWGFLADDPAADPWAPEVGSNSHQVITSSCISTEINKTIKSCCLCCKKVISVTPKETLKLFQMGRNFSKGSPNSNQVVLMPKTGLDYNYWVLD